MNIVLLLGRITKPPELKQTRENTSFCRFSIAVNRKFARQGEEKVDFIPVVVWGNEAEFFKRYFHKGNRVLVSGRINTGKWDDSDGKRHYVTEVVAERIFFADAKKDLSPEQENLVNEYNEDVDGFKITGNEQLPF